jgi:agmatinase
LNIVGADVVEVAPVYDTQAELTGLAAAGVVEALIELMVKKPVGDLENKRSRVKAMTGEERIP